jgi:hypothetical protein
MLKKIDWIEFTGVVICLLFAIVISLYHISFEGYLGLTNRQWGGVWAIAENGFALTLIVLGIMYFQGYLRKICYVFVPYFILKLIYHFSCYSGIHLLAQKSWERLWSIACVILFIVGFAYCLIIIRKRHA